MVQPHDVRQDRDAHRRIDHRRIAEEPFAREGRGDFGEDAEQRQHEDIDLGMPPDPDQVHIHHRRPAEIVGEEVRADIAIEAEQNERRGQDREGGDDQDVRAERGPGEDGHLHQPHARRAQLQDRDDQVDARQGGADAGYL